MLVIMLSIIETPSIFVITISLCLLLAMHRLSELYKNVRSARKTGLPYVIVPLYTATPLWYFSYNWILPAFRVLPSRFTQSWLE